MSFFFQAEDGIRDKLVTGVQTCALPILTPYADPYTDFNLPAYLMKSELFGEFHYQAPLWLPTILLMLNVALSFGAADRKSVV